MIIYHNPLKKMRNRKYNKDIFHFQSRNEQYGSGEK